MQLDLSEIAKKLELGTGLTPSVANFDQGISSTWRFSEFPRPFGLEINLKYELGVARASLMLDNLAAPLLLSINQFTGINWPIIEKLLFELDRNKIQIQVLNLGHVVTSADQDFDGTFEIHGKAVSAEANNAAAQLLSTVISVFGYMAGEEQDSEFGHFRVEGAKKEILSRKYERSRFNRNIAIQIHGSTCKGCAFSFKDFYGEVGDGVIEVHHLTPVHLMEEARVVDPRTDLVPLCSNCHTIVHRVDPPFSLNALQEMVRLGRSASVRSVRTVST